jgi:hypothetical protein
MNTYAAWDWWDCFIWFGVIPLGAGGGLLGILSGYIVKKIVEASTSSQPD